MPKYQVIAYLRKKYTIVTEAKNKEAAMEICNNYNITHSDWVEDYDDFFFEVVDAEFINEEE